MQLNNNRVGEYMSRKYTLTLIALIALCYKLVATNDAMWAVALTGGIAAVLGQYGYFNTKETDAVKELKLKGMAAPDATDPAEPVEPAAQ